MSQNNCPIFTAGFTGQTAIHESSAGRLYVNEAHAHRVQCDGTVYRWHYCYYDTQSMTNLEVAFGAYDAIYDNGDKVYSLRQNSYYLLHLESRENSFTCDTVDLEESEYFLIYDNDRLGACMRNSDDAEFLDILAESASSSYKVAMWGSSSGQCQQSDMEESSVDPDTESGFVLHLYVDISKHLYFT